MNARGCFFLVSLLFLVNWSVDFILANNDPSLFDNLDVRAGGSGITKQLYNRFVECLESAVELLQDCTTCYSETSRYSGGCPACLQSVRCDNFHEGLSRKSGVMIGAHLLKRLQRSTLGRHLNESTDRYELQTSDKPKNVLIGRASFSPQRKRSRFADVDDIE